MSKLFDIVENEMEKVTTINERIGIIIGAIMYILFVIARDLFCCAVFAYALSICFGYPFLLRQSVGILLICYMMMVILNRKDK